MEHFCICSPRLDSIKSGADMVELSKEKSMFTTRNFIQNLVSRTKCQLHNFEKSFWCLQILPKNKRKQVDLRYHSGKVEFVHSFLKRSLRLFLTFIELFFFIVIDTVLNLTCQPKTPQLRNRNPYIIHV